MAVGWRKQYTRYRDLFLNVVALYKKRPETLMFLELILSIITITVLSIVALRPTLIAISQLLKGIETAEQTIDKMNQKISDLTDARQTYQKELTRINLLKTAIPEIPQPETFLRQIEGLTQRYSLSLLNETITEVTLLGKDKAQSSQEGAFPENASPMPISITVSGGYLNLISFISDLENLRRPLKIESLSINSQEVEGAKILTLVFSGNTPYLRQANTASQ